MLSAVYKEKSELTDDLLWVMHKGIPRMVKKVFERDEFHREVSNLLCGMVEKVLLLGPQESLDELMSKKVDKSIKKLQKTRLGCVNEITSATGLVEYNVSYVYHAMYAYFDRDNVALKGLAKFFKDFSKEKRGQAEKFMEYQNKRGGKVKLHPILMPVSEFHNQEKGDASHAMELALSLEKLTNEKLLHVHEVGNKNNDVHLAHFVKTEFLGEQKISEYVAQLRRVGKGHGVWHFNQMLLKEGGAAFSGDVTSQMFLEVF
ncbi:ferritin-3 protein [Artemisia annua]|uniref:Ferritin n=1 Tax=Artemisia annua TaxID=35608 RepID=A0A2U1Q7X6_ARTAN|nr:ferritin-3 protein [Artemisia annua]